MMSITEGKLEDSAGATYLRASTSTCRASQQEAYFALCDHPTPNKRGCNSRFFLPTYHIRLRYYYLYRTLIGPMMYQ